MSGRPNKLHEPDLAGLLVPATVTLAQVQRAIGGLGISQETVARLTEVVITPDRITYDLRLGPRWQRVAVETVIGRKPDPEPVAVSFRVAGLEIRVDS